MAILTNTMTTLESAWSDASTGQPLGSWIVQGDIFVKRHLREGFRSQLLIVGTLALLAIINPFAAMEGDPSTTMRAMETGSDRVFSPAQSGGFPL